ncbi:MAG: pyruvate dehydrogenase (acetyl-transferring) E1 component subunit alpha [Thermoplasmatota archaeon]
MPITTAFAPQEIPHISVLDADGNLDKSLEPKVPKEDLVKLYETMVLSRRYDERRAKLQRQGRIGTFAPAAGQEAAQLGSIYCVNEKDWFCPSFRESACAIWRGADLKDDLLYIAGFEEGMNIPDGARDLPVCIPIGTQYTHALGTAWGSRLQGEEGVMAITYGGDGSTSEGDFHEAINMAGVLKAPVVFFIQNNQWAISTPRAKQTRSETIAQKAVAYGIPGIQVDGNDILAVIHATRQAVERARAGDGPTLIEAITFRKMFHTTADDPTKYRTREVEEEWEAKDPIPRLRAYLTKKRLWNKTKEEELEDHVAATIDDAIARFEEESSRLMTPDYMFANAYVENPPYLERQKKELLAHFEEHGLPAGGH